MNVKHCPIETKPEMFNFFKSYDIYGVAHINHNACMQEKTPFTLIDLKNPGQFRGRCQEIIYIV